MKEQTPFEKFFVFEAPRNKKNVKIVRALPDKRNVDYSKNASNFEDIDDDEMELVDSDDLDMDDTDYSALDDEESNDGTSGDTIEKPTEEENDGSGPNLDDTTDYSGDDGVDSEEVSSEDNIPPTNKLSIEDQSKLHNLFRRYIMLFNTVKKFIAKLDNTVKDSYDANVVISSVTKHLRMIEELLKDYMMLQFQSATYVKSLLFYEKALASVNLSLNLLDNINTNEDSNTKH